MHIARRHKFLLTVFAASTIAAGCSDPLDIPAESNAFRGSTAVHNLNGSVDATAAAFADNPNLFLGERLLDLVLTRSQFLNQYASDFATAQATVDALDTATPSAQSLALRARFRGAIHAFSGASEDAQRASELGANVASDPYDLAQGNDVDAIYEFTRQRALEAPTFDTLSRYAAAAAELGYFEEADAAFQEAIGVYRDVSPFAFAWIAFQRGVMWAERANDADRGYDLYREAIGHLPEYVTANVHLAELEWERGETGSAIERLRRIESGTEDPEPAGLLAEIIADRNPKEAARLVEKAKQRYDSLIETYPLAFLDHGSEFFAGIGGDPERAVNLALDNLDNRRNARAYQVAIEATRAADRPELECQLVEEARPLAQRSANLAALLQASCPPVE